MAKRQKYTWTGNVETGGRNEEGQRIYVLWDASNMDVLGEAVPRLGLRETARRDHQMNQAA